MYDVYTYIDIIYIIECITFEYIYFLSSYCLFIVVPSTPPLHYSDCCALMKIENWLDRNDIIMWNCGIYKCILKVKLYPERYFCFEKIKQIIKLEITYILAVAILVLFQWLTKFTWFNWLLKTRLWFVLQCTIFMKFTIIYNLFSYFFIHLSTLLHIIKYNILYIFLINKYIIQNYII